ncbi:MAG: cytochrome c [Candidatus Obscuribacterales bacterium]
MRAKFIKVHSWMQMMKIPVLSVLFVVSGLALPAGAGDSHDAKAADGQQKHKQDVQQQQRVQQNKAQSIKRGKQLYYANNCQSCHTIGNRGAKFGPALDKLGKHASALEMSEEIHGGADEPEMDFKTRHLTKDEQRSIIDFLLSVQDKATKQAGSH